MLHTSSVCACVCLHEPKHKSPYGLTEANSNMFEKGKEVIFFPEFLLLLIQCEMIGSAHAQLLHYMEKVISGGRHFAYDKSNRKQNKVLSMRILCV